MAIPLRRASFDATVERVHLREKTDELLRTQQGTSYRCRLRVELSGRHGEIVESEDRNGNRFGLLVHDQFDAIIERVHLLETTDEFLCAQKALRTAATCVSSPSVVTSILGASGRT